MRNGGSLASDVTYAQPAASAATASLGQALWMFSMKAGYFCNCLITGRNLASPWGHYYRSIELRPICGDLLVGSFSSLYSFISAVDPTTGMFEGMIPIDVG
jgi:hypothetical protein